MFRRRLFAALIGIAAAGFSATSARAGEYAPVIGQYHPQIILPTVEHDREVALSSYLGRKVLLVHFASW